MTSARAPVVVGIDGSPGAEAALAWALDEARSRAASVRLVHAFGGELIYDSMAIYGNLPAPELPYVRAVARKLLRGAASQAARLAPDVGVTTHAYGDGAVAVLLDESTRASTMVLGSRQLGAVGSAVLGSVGGAVAARADCPVIVVRGPSPMAGESAAVVVGVDARDEADRVLAFAFDFASRRSLPLHAVLCWHVDLLAEMMWAPASPAPARVEARLSEALAGWREKYPDVAAHSAVVREHPVAGLVAAATAQHLLVVGSRGRHALAGTLLGSVGQGVLHHATCPVAVIPDSAG